MHIGRSFRVTWSAWPGDRGRERGIRFRDAVPGRRDRRELRRRFRRVARVVTRERKSETTATLQRLSADHVLLAGVVPGTRDTDDIVEFSDGTRLLISLFSGKADLRHLGLGAPQCRVRLVQALPCFGHRRFWLWFAAADRAVPLEVLASVHPLALVRPEERGGEYDRHDS
ncbi:MAG: hypothetical protein ACRDNW_24750 [Trebonia sp.]